MKKRGLGGVMRKDRYSTSAFLFRFMRATAFLLPITGCGITDPMVQEMETAYATTMRKNADTHEARKAAATQAVQKYFRPGMKAEEAFKRLRQLKQQGFNVSENRHEGERTWPDGEFKSYPDETTRRNLQQHYPKGISEFLAEKKYGTEISLLATKHVVISFRVADGSGVISEVKGKLWASGI